jgi:hypothetical protein
MTGFDQFWAVYPRHEARKDAEKAWRQVDGDRHLDTILAALRWQAPEYLSRERRFRPLPATYLRGERWLDERPAAPPSYEEQTRAMIDATVRREANYEAWKRRQA